MILSPSKKEKSPATTSNLPSLTSSVDHTPTAHIKLTEKFMLGDTDVSCTCTRVDNGSYFIAGSYIDGYVRTFDAATGIEICQFKIEEEDSAVTNFQWKPKNKEGTYSHHLLCVTDLGYIKKYEAESGKLIDEIKPTEDNVTLNALDQSKYGDKFVVGGSDKVATVYDDHKFKMITQLEGFNTEYSGHSNRVFATKFSPFDKGLMASGGWDNVILLYDLRKRGPINSILGPHICGEGIDFFDENTILTGSYSAAS